MIDILSHNDDDAFYFTVDLAQPYVNLQRHGNNEAILSNYRSDFGLFKHADNITIISIGCVLPLGFEFYENIRSAGQVTPWIYLFIKKESAAFGVKELLNPGTITLPFPNYEMSFGQFYNRGVTLGEPYFLIAEFPDGTDLYNQRISMLNVPTALDEMEFHCPIFAKVEHTLDMNTLPTPP